MSVSFTIDNGTEIYIETEECAVECSIDVPNADGTFSGKSVLLNAREAKAVGQALIAAAEASLAKEIKHDKEVA